MEYRRKLVYRPNSTTAKVMRTLSSDSPEDERSHRSELEKFSQSVDEFGNESQASAIAARINKANNPL